MNTTVLLFYFLFVRLYKSDFFFIFPEIEKANCRMRNKREELSLYIHSKLGQSTEITELSS